MCFAFLANACLVRQLLLHCAFHLYPRHADYCSWVTHYRTLVVYMTFVNVIVATQKRTNVSTLQLPKHLIKC